MSFLQNTLAVFGFGRKRRQGLAEAERSFEQSSFGPAADASVDSTFDLAMIERPQSPLDCAMLNASADIAEDEQLKAKTDDIDSVIDAEIGSETGTETEPAFESSLEPTVELTPAEPLTLGDSDGTGLLAQAMAEPLAESVEVSDSPSSESGEVTIALLPETQTAAAESGAYEISEKKPSLVADAVSLASSADAGEFRGEFGGDLAASPAQTWPGLIASENATQSAPFGATFDPTLASPMPVIDSAPSAPDMAAVQAGEGMQPAPRDAVIDELIMALMDEARKRANSTIEAYEVLSLKVSAYAKQSQSSARTAWRMVGSMAAVIAVGGMAGTYLVARTQGKMDELKTRTTALARTPRMARVARTAAYQPPVPAADPSLDFAGGAQFQILPLGNETATPAVIPSVEQKLDKTADEIHQLTDEMREVVTNIKQMQADQTKASQELQAELRQAQQARAQAEQELRTLRQSRAADPDSGAHQSSYTPATQPAAGAAANQADVTVSETPLSAALAGAQPASMRQGPSGGGNEQWNSLLNGK